MRSAHFARRGRRGEVQFREAASRSYSPDVDGAWTVAPHNGILHVRRVTLRKHESCKRSTYVTIHMGGIRVDKHVFKNGYRLWHALTDASRLAPGA